MRSHKKITIIILAALVAVLVASVVALRSEGQNKTRKNSVVVLRRQNQTATMPTAQEMAEANQTPADYAAPDAADPIKRAKRQARGKRYERQGWVKEPSPTAGDVGRLDSWMHKVPAIPAEMSDAIAIVEITDAQSYLSNDKTGVYTEFTVRVDQVLKNDSSAPLVPSTTLTTQREGGRVRFPSGRVQRYKPHFQGMPRTGRQYVLFLKRNEDGETYFIWTGYELRAGRVFPLDGVNLPPGATELPQFAAYKDADEATFLNEVRVAIANLTSVGRGR